jgi:ribosomal protein S18 acetylase RimI-like enzyme
VRSAQVDDEAMFFLDALARSDMHCTPTEFVGAYSDSEALLGVLMMRQPYCHIIWHRHEVLAPFAEYLRRTRTTAWVSGTRPQAEAFLAYFTGEEVVLRQEGTTCVLTLSRLSAVPNRLVRCATQADVARILALEQGVRLHDGGETLAAIARRHIIAERVQAQTAYIAEGHGEVVAIAYADIVLPDAAQVCEVATAPAYRNQGFATACVATLCRALLRHVKQVFLTYADGNLAAARAYDKIGFQPYRRRLRAQLILAAR